MKITVLVRDDRPMIHAGDCPSFRTVVFDLTPAQKQSVQLRHNEEEYSSVILEPK